MQRRTLLKAGAGSCALGALPRAMANEPPVADHEVVFGQSAVLSGPLSEPVKLVVGGAMLALQQANAQGGVAGRQVRLVTLDDQLKPELAVANYRRLLEEQQVLGFFGSVGSGPTAAAAPALQASGAPLIAPYAVADSVRDKTGGLAYFIRAGYGREVEALVQQMSTIGLSRIGIAYLDNPGGLEVLERLKHELGQRKLTLAAAAPVANDGKNAAAAGKALAAAAPQAVILFLAGSLCADVMQAVRREGGSASFYGMSIVRGEAVAQKLGDRIRGLAISQTMPYPWNAADPSLREYLALCEKAQLPVGYNSLEGFLSARVLLEALKRAGRDLSRAKLHAVMKTLKLRLAGMDIDFSGGRPTGSRFIELVHVTPAGRFVR